MGPSRGDDTVEAGLRRVLGRSRELGLLGDGPLEVHIDNADLFVRALETVTRPDSGSGQDIPQRVLDLGSGGGVPGLVVGLRRPDLEVVLLDSQRRRCEFLRWAAAQLDVASRIQVVEGRAEDLARDPGLRGRCRAVTARSFGPPAVTAECAVGFLEGPGGVVLVSEPPGEDGGRWNAEGLGKLGLVVGERISTVEVGTVQVLRLETMTPPEYPRRSGIPAKRPLF